MTTKQQRFTRGALASAVALFALLLAFGGTAQGALKKGSVTKKAIAKGAVTKKAIAKGAVTKKAIKKGAVTKKALAANSVTANAIANGAVTTSELADGAVTTPKIADGAVNRAKLSDEAVGTFGAGLLGARISTPAAGGNLAAFGDGSPIGVGDDFDVPVPTAMTVTDLIAVPDATVPRSVEIRIKKNGSNALVCSMPANADSCQTDESVDFAPGDLLGLQVFVHGDSGAAIGTNNYSIGYRVTP